MERWHHDRRGSTFPWNQPSVGEVCVWSALLFAVFAVGNRRYGSTLCEEESFLDKYRGVRHHPDAGLDSFRLPGE